ncbi:glutathione S-transferase [Polymorphobacter multimanifer]|uniref:Glutathione S-transferase n=1 Tax=Polymorphobacter multimanifer TaxID=1070431 RepID=A0A841L7N1_9SPHN|nr:glutathione S-transferase [Polymorphobacter multimanifer]MBB6228216.1 glutathione S-transferase [Polymorphobacter multimanifer]
MKLIIANRAYSSWSLRGWLAAKLSGLPFSCTLVPMDTPEWDSGAAKGEIPSGKVPVLWDGGEPVWDSMAIVMWLADKGGHDRFWPRDLHARKLAYAMSAEMHAGFLGLRSGCPMNLKLRFPDFAASPDVLADAARIDSLWDEARTRFGEDLDEPYLFGHFSAADVMYAPVVYRFAHYGLPLSDRSRTYLEAMLAHPWMQEWQAEARAETWPLARYLVEGGIPA